jgi:hypothetical protein
VGKENSEYEENNCVHPTPARERGADNDSEKSSGASLGGHRPAAKIERYQEKTKPVHEGKIEAVKGMAIYL